MPKRPRSHDLETESRRSFEAILPAAWPVRETTEDYGVDLEVEIFEGGEATGLTFRVQLKATDKGPKKGRISRGDIKVGTLNYWHELDSPVLVALYSAQSKKFYVRWAHSYDGYHARNAGAATVTFSFGPQHMLVEDVIERWPDDVRFARAFRHKRLPLPLLLQFPVSDGMQGHSDQRLRASLRQALEKTRGIVALVEDGYACTLKLDRESIKIELPIEIGSMTFHVGADQYSDKQGYKSVVADVFVAAASVLIRMGHPAKAAELIRLFKRESVMLRLPDNRDLFVQPFFEGVQASDVFFLIEDWIDARSRHLREYTEHVQFQMYMYSDKLRLTASELRAMVEKLRNRAVIEKDEGRPVAASRTLYSIGEMCRAYRDWPAALDAFQVALENDPTYANRGYFWCAQAGVLYAQGRLLESASAYRRAMACADSPQAGYLLSDILMWRGEYAEARAVPLRDEASDYWALGERFLRRALDSLASIVDVEKQTRSELSRELFEAAEQSGRLDEVLALMRDFDALDPRLWWLLASFQWESDPEAAFNALTVAAYLRSNDPQLWAFAACMAVAGYVEEKIVDDICDGGLKWVGSEFLDAVEEVSNEYDHPEFTAAVRDKVYERANAERPRWPTVLRMVGADGTYEVFELPR